MISARIITSNQVYLITSNNLVELTADCISKAEQLAFKNFSEPGNNIEEIELIVDKSSDEVYDEDKFKSNIFKKYNKKFKSYFD